MKPKMLNETDGVCRTILATYHKIGIYNVFERNFPAVIEFNKNDMAKIYRIRKLIPRETFRLMGVSDTDIDLIQNYPYIPDGNGGWILPEGMTEAEAKKLKISESQQYKLAGNSIVVQVLEGIFTQMFKADQESLF